MFYFEKAYEIINEKLPTNWISNYKFDTEENCNTSIVEITSLLSDTGNSFYHFLNLSVIEGEYIAESTRLKKTLEYCEYELKRIGSTEIESTFILDYDLQIYDWINLNFAKPLISSLKRYKHLIRSIERRITQKDNITTLLDVFRDDNVNNTPIQITEIEKNFKLFNDNLNLAKTDHELKVDKKILQRLILLKDNLEKNDLTHYFINYLIEKCNFLIYKIYYRYQQQKEYYTYAIDFTDKEINIDELKIGYFEKFKKITENHYGHEGELNSFQKKRVALFHKKTDESENHDFCDYHAVIKHYKDDKRSIERLKNLKDKFLNLYEKQKKYESEYNKYAFDIVKGYIINNEFSLLCESREINIETWRIILTEIEYFQEEFGIRNYFPYYKSLLYMEKILDSKFSTYDVDFELINSLMNLYKELLLKYNKALDWCEEKSFLAFQLPYNECISQIEISDLITGKINQIKGFISSSFVLPINYYQLSADLQIFKSNLLKYNTMIEIQKNIRIDKEEIKGLRKAMDNTDKRSIEILSIFSAIVLFVAGDIQLFTKIDNTKEAVTFMLLFGYSLACFVLLIWFTTRADGFRFNKLSRLHNFIIIFFTIATLFCIALVLGWIDSFTK